MKTDDLLFVLVIAGIGLTCFHLINQVFHWQAVKAANHKALLQAQEMYRRLHTATRSIRGKRLAPFKSRQS